jgi:hypothetical protein
MSTTVQPAIKADAPFTPRLVAALIGRPSRTQTVFVECPSYCTEPHASEPEIAVEDITHYGDMFGVQVPTMLDPDTAIYSWFARLNADPAHHDERMRAAHVLIGDESADEAHLTPAMAEELAGDLIAFAAQIRAAAHTARTANASAVTS